MARFMFSTFLSNLRYLREQEKLILRDSLGDFTKTKAGLWTWWVPYKIPCNPFSPTNSVQLFSIEITAGNGLLIDTEGALRIPMAYENHPIPSHPSIPHNLKRSKTIYEQTFEDHSPVPPSIGKKDRQMKLNKDRKTHMIWYIRKGQ